MTKQLVIVQQRPPSSTRFVSYNGVYLGEIYLEVDMEFVFIPGTLNGGAWNVHIMQLILNELKQLNEG